VDAAISGNGWLRVERGGRLVYVDPATVCIKPEPAKAKLSSSMSITVEFQGGTSIQAAAAEAVALATKMGCWVHFKFNDVRCHVSPNSDPVTLVDGFREASKPGVKYPMAFAHTKPQATNQPQEIL
jgi:hypothetical protein